MHTRVLPAYLAAVCCAVAFVAPFVSYACKAPCAAMGLASLALALLVGAGVVALVYLLRKLPLARVLASDRAFKAVLGVGGVALLATQALIVRGGLFVTGWDVFTLCDFGNVSGHAEYYSTYPNQLFLAGLFARLVSMGEALGFGNGYPCVESSHRHASSRANGDVCLVAPPDGVRR